MIVAAPLTAVPVVESDAFVAAAHRSPLHHSHLRRWPHRRTDRARREKATRPKARPPASWAISRLQSRAEVTYRRDAEGDRVASALVLEVEG
jgi:hypothetical protein